MGSESLLSVIVFGCLLAISVFGYVVSARSSERQYRRATEADAGAAPRRMP